MTITRPSPPSLRDEVATVQTRRCSDQLVCTVTDSDGVLGHLVVDSFVAGRACGGLRMLPDIEEAEMRGLARAMTLKYGLLGLPHGGAKAGVRGDPERPRAERRERLAAFAAAIAPLLRRKVFVPYADMGTDAEDIRAMQEDVGVRLPRRQRRGADSGRYTAMSVRCGVQQAAEHLGVPLNGASAAIEGFGSVGRPLARMLADSGARVVAVSTSRGALHDPGGLDVGRLTALTHEHGSRAVEVYDCATCLAREELLELEVDVLCPCARHASIHAGNAGRIAAKIISPGANDPVTPEAEAVLGRRSVLCLPDFVTNCGGVLGGTMEFASVRPSVIRSFIDRHLGSRIAWLLREADRSDTPPRELAESIALARFAEVREEAERPTALRHLFGLALQLHRHGWLPGSLVASLSLRYFRGRLAPMG